MPDTAIEIGPVIAAIINKADGIRLLQNNSGLEVLIPGFNRQSNLELGKLIDLVKKAAS